MNLSNNSSIFRAQCSCGWDSGLADLPVAAAIGATPAATVSANGGWDY